MATIGFLRSTNKAAVMVAKLGPGRVGIKTYTPRQLHDFARVMGVCRARTADVYTIEDLPYGGPCRLSGGPFYCVRLVGEPWPLVEKDDEFLDLIGRARAPGLSIVCLSLKIRSDFLARKDAVSLTVQVASDAHLRRCSPLIFLPDTHAMMFLLNNEMLSYGRGHCVLNWLTPWEVAKGNARVGALFPLGRIASNSAEALNGRGSALCYLKCIGAKVVDEPIESVALLDSDGKRHRFFFLRLTCAEFELDLVHYARTGSVARGVTLMIRNVKNVDLIADFVDPPALG